MRIAAVAAILAPAFSLASEPLVSPDLPPADTWVQTSGGQVRVLDKQKAQSHLVVLKSGQTVTFETLSLTLLACVVHPPDLVGNAAGFLQITDSRNGEPGFRGWMLARQPGLATLQSPVYDVRVVGCETPTAEQIAASLPPKLPSTPVPAPAVSIPPTPDTDLNPPPGQDLDGSPAGQ